MTIDRQAYETIKTAQNNTVDYDAAASLMDDDLRETLSSNWDHGWDPQRFFNEYCEAHAEKFGETFIVN